MLDWTMAPRDTRESECVFVLMVRAPSDGADKHVFNGTTKS